LKEIHWVDVILFSSIVIGAFPIVISVAFRRAMGKISLGFKGTGFLPLLE